MNKTYRKIFNAVRGAMVAVAENVSAANQRGSVTVGAKTSLRAMAIAALVSASLGTAQAGDSVTTAPTTGVSEDHLTLAGVDPDPSTLDNITVTEHSGDDGDKSMFTLGGQS